jgi:hypothetical protein
MVPRGTMRRSAGDHDEEADGAADEGGRSAAGDPRLDEDRPVNGP